MNKVLIATICFCLSLSALPATAQHDDFPDELKTILSGQVPLGPVPIGINVPGFTDDIGTEFVFFDNSDGVAFNRVLCYPLAESSISDSLDSPGPGTVLSGVVFIYCPEIIEINSPNQFLLFFQQVEPAIDSLIAIESRTIDLQFLTDSAIASNYGEYCFHDDDVFKCVQPACEDSLNNLDSETPPLVCLSGCCGAGAEFRLPGVQYVDIGSGRAEFTAATSFNFADSNFRQFFRHYSFFTGLVDDPKLETFFTFQQFEIPLYQPGDTNSDGQLDLLDVAGFLDCLTDGIYVFQCDINQDLAVDLLDVAPFVDLLSGE